MGRSGVGDVELTNRGSQGLALNPNADIITLHPCAG